MRGISVLLVVVGVALARAQVDQCPAEQETDWSIELLLRHEDCNKFYKCTFGEPVEQSCFGGLYFNLATWQCDWPENVDCEDRNDPANPTPETTTAAPTTPEPTTSEPTTPEPTIPEPTTPEPTTPEPTTAEPITPEPTTPEPTTPEPTIPEPTTPEPTTAEPTTPEPTTPESTTPELTTPEPTTQEPTTPEPTTTEPTAAPTETTTVYPTPEPETEPPTEEIEILPNGCPVDPHVHWLLPNEADCNQFYYCVWGELVPRICPAGLHFNPSIQVCDWPDNAGCTVSVNKHAEARRHFLKQLLA